jgi:hypothetical protein
MKLEIRENVVSEIVDKYWERITEIEREISDIEDLNLAEKVNVFLNLFSNKAANHIIAMNKLSSTSLGEAIEHFSNSVRDSVMYKQDLTPNKKAESDGK